MILTNDGELAGCLQQPSVGLERVYNVRVFGVLNENKMNRMRY